MEKTDSILVNKPVRVALYVAFVADADAIAEVCSSSPLEIQVTNEKIGVRQFWETIARPLEKSNFKSTISNLKFDRPTCNFEPSYVVSRTNKFPLSPALSGFGEFSYPWRQS